MSQSISTGAAPRARATERDLLASYLFEDPSVLLDPARPRSAGPDGTVQGSYVLTPLPGDSGLPFASPVPIEVLDGTWMSLDVHYDSGIR